MTNLHTILSIQRKTFDFWEVHIVRRITESKSIGVVTVRQSPLVILFGYPLDHSSMTTPSNTTFNSTIGLVDRSSSADFQNLNRPTAMVVAPAMSCDRNVPSARTYSKASNWFGMNEVRHQMEGEATVAFLLFDTIPNGAKAPLVQLQGRLIGPLCQSSSKLNKIVGVSIDVLLLDVEVLKIQRIKESVIIAFRL